MIYHAGIDYSATWSQGTVPDGQPDKFYVTLSGGGPSAASVAILASTVALTMTAPAGIQLGLADP